MSQAQVIEEISRGLAEEARVDCVGLWTVLWEVKQRLPSLTPAEARVVALAVIHNAIEQGMVVPGEFVAMRFVPWEGPPEEAVQRIESRWLALGREPNIGEVVWFTSRTVPS
jgi:hypothetical protein